MLLYFTPHCIHFHLLVVSTNNSLTHRPSSKIEASRKVRACLRAGGGPQVGHVTRFGRVTRLSVQYLITFTC